MHKRKSRTLKPRIKEVKKYRVLLHIKVYRKEV